MLIPYNSHIDTLRSRRENQGKRKEHKEKDGPLAEALPFFRCPSPSLLLLPQGPISGEQPGSDPCLPSPLGSSIPVSDRPAP